jgi:alkylation response protein AidB-like acyl-CoA dehydrogenase
LFQAEGTLYSAPAVSREIAFEPPGELALAARRLADEVLFPAALATDAAARVPETSLSQLASAGLFGVAGPRSHGGREVSPALFAELVETLASGCLATAFVWVQHHGAVRALAETHNRPLAERWLAALCAGQRRAGLALSGARPGPRQLRAARTAGGWLLQGSAPWVTGWTLVDVLLAPARSDDDRTLHLLLDALDSETLEARAVPLVAANASCTVELTFRSHFVPDERLLAITPYAELPAHDGGGRSNGSLALGVARRACASIGPSPLDAELDARRRQLDDADELTLASARAAAAELALRASAALLTRWGSRSIALDSHGQRLAREALFLLVFGSRAAIQSALLAELGATPRSPAQPGVMDR